MVDPDALANTSEVAETDVDLLAASLRASSSDLTVFVEVLADKLAAALPGRVDVARRSTRFLGKQKRVARLQCDLGGQRFLLEAHDGLIETRRATAVRGVVLKTEELSLSEWLDGLARELANEARTSEHARLALQQLLER
jgi:predicted LPLAT superfamily acyltransferase